jgi:hypothetical protein
MNIRLSILFISFCCFKVSLGQDRTITGKVIDEEFRAMGRLASVWSADTVKLVETDSNGLFVLSIPSHVEVLLVAAVGMEWRRIELTKDCSFVEVVLMYRPTYCYNSPQKVDRMRKRDFEKLAGLHLSAFQKGIFESERPCYSERFVSRKGISKR